MVSPIRVYQLRSVLLVGLALMMLSMLSACGGGSTSTSSSLTNEDFNAQQLDDSYQSQKIITQIVDGKVVNRSYLIRKPQHISKESYPVVFFFHGADDNGEDWLSRNPQVSALIDDEEFIGIFPDAHQGNWNLGDPNNADDIEFISSIVNNLNGLPIYSQNLLHAVGIQQGANLVNKLAKETSLFHCYCSHFKSTEPIHRRNSSNPTYFSISSKYFR